jgi:hypothetical protein
MKNIFFLLFSFLFSVATLQAQSKVDHREKIKALKVAFITEELQMSTDVAQKFWPVYNRYETQRRALHKREHLDLDKFENISEEKAEEMLKEYLVVEKEEYMIKRELFSDLRKFLSARDIIKLHKLEDDFNKKLLKEYHSRKENEKNQRE